MKLLFVTWDGPATSYHETLFLPLLQRAQRHGDRVNLLQFSWGADERAQRLAQVAASHVMGFEHRAVPRGLGLIRLPWLLAGSLRWVLGEIRAGRCDTVMARSIIPGGLIALARRVSRTGFAFIYDADGLPADERVEFGGWPRAGLRYRLFRRIERASVRSADVVLTRTSTAVDILRRRADRADDRFVVVVNGKDEQAFHPMDPEARRHTRERFGVPVHAPLVVYAGSIGPQYEASFMLDTFRRVLCRAPEARFLALTPQRNHGQLRSMARDIPEDHLLVREATAPEMPALLATSDLGLAFRTPTFSQRAVAPIKIAEYLLCGVPVAYRSGIGDLDEQLDPTVGVAVATSEESEASRVADWFVDQVMPDRDARRGDARKLGLERFSLDAGARSYRRAFDLIEP